MKKLDSEQGMKALERVLGAAAIQKHGRAGILNAYMESWSHPWLARYAEQQGWKDCHDLSLRLEDATGHFDHAPYATTSCSGPGIPMPFETAECGRVFFVKWERRVIGVHIMGQVENHLRTIFYGKNTWMPSWAGACLHHTEAVRHGLGALGESQEAPSRAKDLREGIGALEALCGPIQKEVLGWDCWSQEEREGLAEQLKRLPHLSELLEAAVGPACQEL